MLEISVTFEEFQLVFDFMLFFHFNTIFFNSWKMQGSKDSRPGFYGPDKGHFQTESYKSPNTRQI